MYKRKHPHIPNENTGCGSCAYFLNEDTKGNGYCEMFKAEQSCGIIPCKDYKSKK